MNTKTDSNRVELGSEGLEPPSWAGGLKDYVGRVLDYLQISGWEVSILIASAPVIRNLNNTYRGRDEVTDVLSFPAFEGHVPQSPSETPISVGDIVVCPERVAEQAPEFGADFDEELRRVVVHGLLHLAGYTHTTNDFEREPMLTLQESTVKAVAGRIA